MASKITFLIISSIVWLTGCSTKPDNEISTSPPDTLKSISYRKTVTLSDSLRSGITETSNTKKKIAIFDNKKPFVIAFFKRSITSHTSASDTNMCKGWSLSEEALDKVIRDCQRISGTEWDLSFDVLPCIIEGQVVQAGQSYKFEINGGSWMQITYGDTTILLGNYNKRDRKYFVSQPYEE